jgi:hypothetical protein
MKSEYDSIKKELLYAKLLKSAAIVENEVMRMRDFPNGSSEESKRLRRGTAHDRPIKRVGLKVK